jgi:hypothetical protein
MGLSIAGFVEFVSDQFLPEPVGDLLSMGVNIATGNLGAAIDDGVDLFTGDSRDKKPSNDGFGFEPAPPPEYCPTVQPAPNKPAIVTPVIDGKPAAGQPGTSATDKKEPPKPEAASGSGEAPKQADRDYDKDFENIQKGIKPEWMEQKDFDKLMLQRRIEEYSAMMTLLSNLMKALHEANMACIRNISA